MREALLGAVVLLLLLWALLGAVLQEMELLVLVSGSSEVVEDTITLLSWISSSPNFREGLPKILLGLSTFNFGTMSTRSESLWHLVEVTFPVAKHQLMAVAATFA